MGRRSAAQEKQEQKPADEHSHAGLDASFCRLFTNLR